MVFSAGERADLRDAIQNIGGGGAGFPEGVPQFSAEKLMSGLAKSRPGAIRISDKTLIHFALLGLIRIVLPNAHVIHVNRNPVDVCLSCYSKLFDDDLPFTYDLGELGRYYRGYEKMMAHWHSMLPSGWILDVKYEELVEDFEQQARRILSHCGLPWAEACLSFHETKRAVRTASSVQVRQPLYRTSMRRWRPDDRLLSALLAGLELNEGTPGRP